MEETPTKRPANKHGKSGRPRVEESLSDTIIRIRNETGWGHTKIVQAMRRLGHKVSPQTIKDVLIAAGLRPSGISAHLDLTMHREFDWPMDHASSQLYYAHRRSERSLYLPLSG